MCVRSSAARRSVCVLYADFWYAKKGLSLKNTSQRRGTYLKNAFLSHLSGNVLLIDVASVVRKLQAETS